MIHRALFGSIERFFGVLLEHYAGAFPTWLAPVQVRVLPVSRRPRGLRRARSPTGCRPPAAGSTSSSADEQLGKRIRTAKLEKLPVRARGRRRRRRRRHGRRQPARRRGRARRARRRLRRAAARRGRTVARSRRLTRRCSTSSGPAGGRATSSPAGRGAEPTVTASRVRADPRSRAARRRDPHRPARRARASRSSTPSRTPPGTCWCCRTARSAELEDARRPTSTTELWATVTDAVRAIKAAYRPEGVNVGINLGRPAGGGVSRAPPRPRPAALDRRHATS